MNWSRSTAKEYFETLMSDRNNASIKWFYSQDDEFALGIMEALEGSAIDDATKQTILDNKIVISAAGGSEALYSVHPRRRQGRPGRQLRRTGRGHLQPAR